MKKAIYAAVLLLLLAAASGWTAGIDLVVMVDVSESMFPVFDDLVNYLLRDLLENRLHQGDSFHLLSFADSPEVEVSADIEDTSDLTSVIDRILLLKPLGQYTDLIAALEFLLDYTRSLDSDNRKLVLLLTDGIHDPPPGSPNRVDYEQVLARLLASTQKIKREGWEIHILSMPREGGIEAAGVAAVGRTGAEAQASEPGTGQDLMKELAEELGGDVVEYEEVEKDTLTGRLTGFSTLEFPGFLGKVRSRVSAAFRISNFSSHPVTYTLVDVRGGGASLLLRPASVTIAAGKSAAIEARLQLPPGLQEGRQSLAVRLSFEDPQQRISPLEGELEFEKIAPFAWLSGVRVTYLIYGLFALVALVLILLLVFLIRRRLQDATFARFFEGLSETRRGKKSIRPLIMRVDSQNPNIGARNIHRVPPGARLSVGGDGSSFLIYYVPMPRRIGDIRNVGGRYRFVPKKPEHFIDLDQPLMDCLGKPIRAVSNRGREVIFRFLEYISPLEEINRLMRSVPKFRITEEPKEA
jgi:hypothetical protein